MSHMVRNTLRSVASRLYWSCPHFLGHVTGRVLILMYHRVIPPSDVASTFVQPGMFVTPNTFECHLRFLKSHFELLTFQELLDRWQAGVWDHGRRYCTITFDDGWLDNYRYAYPLLSAYRAPATIFLPTDLIGTDEWLWSDRLGSVLHRQRAPRRPEHWDALVERVKTLPDDVRERFVEMLERATDTRRPRSRRFINWDEARDMSRGGVAFGSHSSTHATLTRAAGTVLDSELRRPLEALGEQGVTHVPVLAYPNGDHSAAVVAAARAAGYRAAVTTRPGPESSRPDDLFRLRRIGVHDDVTRSVPALTLHIARQVRAA